MGLTAAEGSFDFLVEMVAINRWLLLAWIPSTNRGVTCLTTENRPSGMTKRESREEKLKGDHTRMIMRQTDKIDPGQVMQVDSRVRQSGPRNPRPEMDMVARVEEVLCECIRKDAQIYILLVELERVE